MLDRFERDKLREIEHQISAADPELAAFLRGAQGRLPRPRSRIGLRVLVALLVLLTAGLLVLGLLASALVVSTVAAVLWRWRGSASSTRGGDALCLVSGRRQRSARGARCGDPPPSPMCATPGGCCGRASTRCPRSPTARGRCRRWTGPQRCARAPRVVVVRVKLPEDLVVAVLGEGTGLPVLGVVERSEAARADHCVVLGDLPVEELGRSGFGLSAAADTVRRIGHIASPSERRVQTVECGSASRRA
jgi:hypothetical protein